MPTSISKVNRSTTGIFRDAYLGLSDDGDSTALIIAAKTGHLEMAKLLVSKGADVNLKGN